MGRLYTIDEDSLNEKNEIRIGDRIYAVDDRLSNYEMMTKELNTEANQGREFDIIISYALGEKAHDEIKKKDLSFSAMQKIIIMIMAAMQDITEDEAEKRFRKS